MDVAPSYRTRIDSLCRLVDAYDSEIKSVGVEIARWLDDDLGYQAVQAIKGVGPILAAVFIAEIGDIGRFSSPDKLCCWAGLTPKHRESDSKVMRGGITKQGSRLVRWAAIESISPGATPRWPSSTPGSKSAGAPTWPGWPRRANFFTSSITACATARSAVWPRRGDPGRT